MATATTGTRRPPPPPPEDATVRVVEPPHHERDHRPPPPSEPRVITGVIIDADTHQPVGRASVDITHPSFRGEMTVQTGADGRYRTSEIPRGEFGIRVRREGYEVFERKAVMNDGTAHIDFELRKRH